MISLSEIIKLDLNLMTLTYTSTGGPATTVTWTRDNVALTDQGAVTLLNDPVTAQYTHTLAVTTTGMYTCTVANEKPSSASASITVESMLLYG